MEKEEAVYKAVQRRTAGDRGKGYDQNPFAIQGYDEKWEKHAHTLPVFRSAVVGPLQNPDGTFRYMAGMDGLGEVPLGG